MKNGLLILVSAFFIFFGQEASSQDKIYNVTIDGNQLYNPLSERTYTFKEDFGDKLRFELGASNFDVEINPDSSITLILIGYHDVKEIMKLVTAEGVHLDSNVFIEEDEALQNTKATVNMKREKLKPSKKVNYSTIEKN